MDWPAAAGRSAAQLGQRVLVVLLDLLASTLRRSVAQDHALRRLADDLVKRGQQDGVVHRVAALLDDLGPFQLALPVGRGKQRRVLVDRSAGYHLPTLGCYRLRLGAAHEAGE